MGSSLNPDLNDYISEEDRERVRAELKDTFDRTVKDDSALSFDASRALDALMAWDTHPARVERAKVLNERDDRHNERNEEHNALVKVETRMRTFDADNVRRHAWRWYAGTTGSGERATELLAQEESLFGPLPEKL